LVQKKGNDRRMIFSSGPILVIVLLVILSLFTYQFREPASIALSYGHLEQLLRVDDPAVKFEKIRVGPGEVHGKIVTGDPLPAGVPDILKPGETREFQTRLGLPGDKKLLDRLRKRAGGDFDREPEESMSRVFSAIGPLIMILMTVGIGFVLFRLMSGGNSPFSFGRSKHKLYEEKGSKVTFENVAGIDEAVAELREIVDFLKTPEKYQALGGRIPKGVLLVGPPGTGKTLLARAIAGEANVPFFSMSGSDFVEMFVGVGASRVRDLFSQAETRAPCIIFIDELDALGKTRGGGSMGGHDEREQTLNQLLVEMDGFESNRGVILMAATNRPETLDPALMRPGRFDRQVLVDRPDIQGREAILKVHARTVKLGKDVDLRHIASLTPGSSGADLANLVNESALLAARGNKDEVTMADMNEAIERKDIGLERKSRIMRPEEKARVAYHEAGHALVACSLPTGDPVHKVTIIPRGLGALGYVLQRPDDDRHMHTRTEIEARIKVSLGGTLAEELIYGEIANGATSDLNNANGLARLMVTQFGMSRMGRIFVKESNDNPFLAGSSWSTGMGCSEQMAREIDAEIRKIIDDSVDEVRELLAARRNALVALADKLIEKETIDGAQVLALIEAHYPGPKLVLGTSPVTPAVPRVTPTTEEETRRAE
jgi:cell division protease FtsH